VDRNKVATFQKGVTSCSQIRTELGEPLETARQADGTKLLTFGKYTSTVRGESFIPIVGIFAGGADTEYDVVEIKCDGGDVFVEYTARKGQVGTDTLP
jgi:hypothetical protein